MQICGEVSESNVLKQQEGPDSNVEITNCYRFISNYTTSPLYHI